MKLLWTLAAVAGLIAGPVCAQGLIPPSRQYLTPKREGLDKSYGLPTFGTPSESMPKQQATALPKQEPPATPFTGLSTFARPDASPSDAPDFFQKPSGLASSETGVPNFFEGTPDAGRPKVGAARTGETPLYTTDEGDTTGGDTTVGKTPAAAASDD